MKNKTKKMLAGMMTVCVIAGSLAGCGKEKQQTASKVDLSELGEVNGLELPIVDKDTKISFLMNTSQADLEDKFFLQAVKDITGITIEPVVVSDANGQQKLQLLAASKQLPDIARNFLQSNDIDELALNGALVNITENIDKMPNLKKLYKDTEENKRVFSDYASSDGNLYVIPAYGIARDVNHLFMYRKDIFDKLGIKPWTDTESFYNTLKKLKEAYPDSTPLTSKLQFDLFKYFGNQWGFETDLDKAYDAETKEWVYAGVSSNMKNMLDFLKKLYDEGLLDPEFLTNTQASWTAKMTAADKAFVTFDWVDRMDMFVAQAKSTVPGYDLEPGRPIGLTGKYMPMDPIGGTSVFITNNKKSDISIKLVDFLMSKAGGRLETVGLPGKTYEYDENKKVKYLGFEKGQSITIKDLEEKYGLFTGGIAMRYDPECIYFQFTPRTQTAQELVNNEDLMYKLYPRINVGKDTEKYNELFSALNKAFEEFASKYILGAKDVSWKGWLEQAESLGSDEMGKIIRKHAKGQTR